MSLFRSIATVHRRQPRSRAAVPTAGGRAECLRKVVVLVAACHLLCGCTWLDKVKRHPTLEAHGLMEQAHRAEESGRMKQAEDLLHRAIDANPEDAAARRELARLLLEQGAVDAAVEQLRLAVGQSPDDVDSHVQLARIQLDHRRYDGAEEEIAAALTIDPDHVEALLLKAELAEIGDRDALALETFHRVLARDPDNVTARQRVAEIQIAAGRPDRAAPLLRAVCECNEANEEQRAAALWSLGIVYGRQARWKDAAAALAASVPRRRSMTADDWYRLAYARYAAGDWNGAAADAERALRSQPNHKLALAMSNSLRATADNRTPVTGGYQRMAMAVPTPAGW